MECTLLDCVNGCTLVGGVIGGGVGYLGGGALGGIGGTLALPGGGTIPGAVGGAEVGGAAGAAAGSAAGHGVGQAVCPDDDGDDDDNCDTPLTKSDIERLKKYLGGSEALHKEKEGYGDPPKYFDFYKCRNGDIVIKRKGEKSIVAYTGLNINSI